MEGAEEGGKRGEKKGGKKRDKNGGNKGEEGHENGTEEERNGKPGKSKRKKIAYEPGEDEVMFEVSNRKKDRNGDDVEEIFSDEIDPPMITAEKWKRVIGLNMEGKVVAYKPGTKFGAAQAIVRYGPRSHGIYRLENAVNYPGYESTINVTKRAQDLGLMRKPDNLDEYLYDLKNFAGITAVAWNVERRPAEPLALIDPDRKGEGDLPDRFGILRVLVVYKTQEGLKEWWETRAITQRVFPGSSIHADKMIHIQAKEYEELHAEWQKRKNSKGKKKPSPDKNIRILTMEERQALKLHSERRSVPRSTRATPSKYPTPEATKSPSPDPKIASKAIPSEREAWIKQYREMNFDDRPQSQLSAAEKSEMVDAWQMSKNKTAGARA